MTQTSTTPTKARKPSHKYIREQDNRMVKGKFVYNELPGGVLEFNFIKHKGDPSKKYTFVDGKIYTVPLSVARHLNKDVAYPQYEHIPGEELIGGSSMEDGQTMRIQHMIKRCSFEPLDFMVDEDLMSAGEPIIKVQAI